MCFMFGLRDLIWKLVRWLISQVGYVIQVLDSSIQVMRSSITSWGFLGSKKNPKRRHRCQTKMKVRRWQRRALPYGCAVKCLC